MNRLIHQQITGARGGSSSSSLCHRSIRVPLGCDWLIWWFAHLFTAAFAIKSAKPAGSRKRDAARCLISLRQSDWAVYHNSCDMKPCNNRPVVQTAGTSDPHRLVLVAQIKLISTTSLVPLTCHRHRCRWDVFWGCVWMCVQNSIFVCMAVFLQYFLFMPVLLKSVVADPIFIPPKETSAASSARHPSVMSSAPPHHFKLRDELCENGVGGGQTRHQLAECKYRLNVFPVAGGKRKTSPQSDGGVSRGRALVSPLCWISEWNYSNFNLFMKGF